MADHAVILKREEWSEAANADIAQIKGDVLPEWYHEEVAAGLLSLLGIYGRGGRIGTVIYRLENVDFVIVAAAGAARFDLVQSILPVLEGFALNNNRKYIRFHTARRGLVNKAAKLGYGCQEVVLRKGLHYGR